VGLAIRDFLLINPRTFYAVEHKLEIFFFVVVPFDFFRKRLSSFLKVASMCETRE
jgi:hypothetical protein